MFIDSNKQKVWFTADTHFGHKNIIKYCDRPFKDVVEMNAMMIEKWNAKVGKDDIVFHIGDFAFIKDKPLLDLIHNLNGKIILIPGNHDDVDNYANIIHKIAPNKFDVATELFEVNILVEDEKLRFVLCHYALRVWNKSHYGAIHLYGHSHGTLPDDPTARSMDVGADCHGYAPISLDDVLLTMYKKVFKPVDHHEDKMATRKEIVASNLKS